VVGAGAVVVNDFPGEGTLVGVPARPVDSKRNA
jgi:serine acetyltransferase